MVQSDGVRRYSREELDPLIRALGGIDTSFRVRMTEPAPKRYGIHPDLIPELVNVWLPEVTKYLLGAISSIAVKWAVQRVRELRNRKITVDILGPDGRVVKSVHVAKNLSITEKDYQDPITQRTKKHPRLTQ